ncbi:metallophosphoesterase family protein [Phytoactinopolyspora limicola]|uniref:metallophosphoesterase family protein n=1 Tax=Phytoactinopolyspora limicola TaxID=2715536 RepID=UPI00140C0C04|nr:DNA repair exonuclease [Phytoactinopolyspora limicola]
MPTIVHAADLHLNSPLRGLPGLAADLLPAPTWTAFDALIDLVMREQADVLILAGDLTDRDWYDGAVARRLHDSLAALHEAAIPVLITSGNHDATCRARERMIDVAGPLPPATIWFDTDHAHTHVLDDIGVAAHGRSLPAGAIAADLVPGFPSPVPDLLNVGILHTSLDGTRPGKPCAPTTVSALNDAGYQYWALGHVHTREVVSRDPLIVYPGNIQGRGIGEPGPKGATVIDVDGTRVTRTTHHELAAVRWERVRVDTTGHRRADEIIEHTLAVLDHAADVLEPGQRLAARIEIAAAPPTLGDQAEMSAGIRAAATRDPRFLLERIEWV